MTGQPTQDDVLDRLCRWAQARESIRTVILTSTRAVAGASVDALSDYDVILVVRDIRPYVTERSWLDDFGEVLVAYWDPVQPDPIFGIDKCGNVVQYAQGLKIDFSLWPVGLFQKIAAAALPPAELEAGYRVLLDKDGLTARLPRPTYRAYVPKPPSQADFELFMNDFLSDAPYVAKCLWRDELLPAKWCLDYDMKLVYLRQLLEWRMEIEQEWSIPAGALGKGLKKHLPEALWKEVELTFAGAGLEENWAALERTMRVFRQVAMEVGRHLGYCYPEELHERVWAYVNTIRRMEHDR